MLRQSMDSGLLFVLALAALVLAAVALRQSEGFCPAGWASADGGCSKNFEALRCRARMLPGGRLEFDGGCSKYARDMITRQTM